MLAELNVKTCQLQYDRCTRTKQYERVGQIIVALESYERFLPMAMCLHEMIEMWIAGGKHEFNSFGFKNYKTIIHDRSSRVGCALSRYSTSDGGKRKVSQFVCNFSNTPTDIIYETGPACTKCETTCNNNFNGLCNSM